MRFEKFEFKISLGEFQYNFGNVVLTKDKWNLVYLCLCLSPPYMGIIVFMLHVATDRQTIFLTLVAFTLTLFALTVIYLVNLVKKTFTFKSRVLVFLLLLSYNYLYVSWTLEFKPPPELVCRFNISDFESEVQLRFNADSINFYSSYAKEELYFIELVPPKLNIYNLRTKDGTLLEMTENQFKLICQPLADTIHSNCDMSGFNDLMICDLKKRPDGKYYFHDNIVHYYTTAYDHLD